jgi:glycosyltransferase involved in cell wall biosynthesis
MIRYLEAHAPCIYIPNYDFGHSCISSQLSGSVAIVGIVHSDDPRHYDHVVRLGGYWNAVVAVSSAIAAETRGIAPALASRISTIPYGVAAADNLTGRSLKGRQPLRVIYAGRLDQEQKRVLDLPRIVQAVAALGVPIHLTIAGSGRLAAELKAQCDGQPVEFLGTVESAALPRILAGQDVCLLTSAFEGLPIGVLEAMGQGCIPLVGDIRSGIPELIEDGVNGFRVPVGDIPGFASRLTELYRNSGLREQMSRAAWTKARSDCYRTERMVESYATLFASLPDTTHARRAGRIKPPPDLPWAERLPGAVQMCGHRIRQLATIGSRQ